MLMKKLTRSMWKELESAENYAKHAEAYKVDHPKISDMYKKLAKEEMEHSKMFYDHSMELAEKEKEKTGEIPNWLIESWRKEIEDYHEKMAKVKYMIDMLK